MLGLGRVRLVTPLHVAGEAGVDLYNSSGGGDVFNFRTVLGDAQKYMSISSYDHATNGTGSADGLSINGKDGVSIATGTDSTRTERLRVDASGNVGIGTSSPTRQLHVSGGSTDTVLLLESSDANVFMKFADGNTTYEPHIGAKTNDLVFLRGAASFAEAMRIDSSGNVACGDYNFTKFFSERIWSSAYRHYCFICG